MSRITTTRSTTAAAIALLAVALLLTVGRSGSVATAQRSEPPPGPDGQRFVMIAELRDLNGRLAELLEAQRLFAADTERRYEEQQKALRRLEAALVAIPGSAVRLADGQYDEILDQLGSLNMRMEQTMAAQDRLAESRSQWQEAQKEDAAKRDRELRALLESGRVQVVIAVPEEKKKDQ